MAYVGDKALGSNSGLGKSFGAIPAAPSSSRRCAADSTQPGEPPHTEVSNSGRRPLRKHMPATRSGLYVHDLACEPGWQWPPRNRRTALANWAAGVAGLTLMQIGCCRPAAWRLMEGVFFEMHFQTMFATIGHLLRPQLYAATIRLCRNGVFDFG